MRNPFSYCPNCGAPEPDFIDTRKFYCKSCEFTYYHNIATATGALLEYQGQVVLLKRNLEPGKGLWDLPGGFVDPSESAEEAILRECREEIQITPDNLTYLMSRPNTYLYKNVEYRTCDIFFTGQLSHLNYQLQEKEVSELILVNPENCPIDKIAFPSVKAAILIWLEKKRVNSK